MGGKEKRGNDLGVYNQTFLYIMLITHTDDSVRLSLFLYFIEQP